MTKELSLQDAKDLAFKYKENEEIYTLAKNLEDALDGTRGEVPNRIDYLEDEVAEAERRVEKLEGVIENAKELLSEVEAELTSDNPDIKAAISLVKDFNFED